MNDYTIYCTPEQTKKALELGAKIEIQEYYPLGEIEPDWFHDEDKCYHIPTAEQMIGWLEEKGLYFSIVCIRDYVYEVWIKDINKFNVIINSCINARKEATLAAIDAALDYLSKNK